MGKPHLLIADDEEGIREALRLILGGLYQLTFAVDGQDAVAKAAQQRFDLILLDIKMPKLDGLEVLKRIRQQNPQVAVLMLTAYQSVELAKEALNHGALSYLPKPFERDAIQAAVAEALSKPTKAPSR